MFCTMPDLLKENEESPVSTAVTYAQVKIPMCVSTRLCQSGFVYFRYMFTLIYWQDCV